MSFENVVFSNLIHNEAYTRQVIPFLKPEYFQAAADRIIFELIDAYIQRYNTVPSISEVAIDLSNKTGLNEHLFDEAKSVLQSIDASEKQDLTWLIEHTEEFCKDRAIYNALMESISIHEDKTGKKSREAIPQILSDALSVTFDSHVGHDFLDDADARYSFYHKAEKKLPFDLEFFNKITQGGLSAKTLNVCLAGTGVGKTLLMCHMAASWLAAGYNVLYITLEMAEERIAERIDANLLNMNIHDLEDIPKPIYDAKIMKLKSKTNGRLIIKEYPTSCAGAANFRHLINELRLKRKFKPDVILVDYINICMSSRVKFGSTVNSYTYIKFIAEELRGLAVENDVPLFTATQTNRQGYSSSDVELENTAESWGLPQTADFMFAMISSEEMEALNQIMIKQLKNRYGDDNFMKRFVVGIDRTKMRLFDVENSAQNLTEDVPVFDSTKFGTENSERGKKFSKDMFDGFK